MAGKVPIISHGIPAKDSERAIQALQTDVASVGRALNALGTVTLTGLRLVMPVSGVAVVSIVSDTATAGSGVAYHVLNVLRSGQSEGKAYTTTNAELPAYTRVYMGTYRVAAGDLLTVSVSVTGVPVPLLSTANICLLCVLTPVTGV